MKPAPAALFTTIATDRSAYVYDTYSNGIFPITSDILRCLQGAPGDGAQSAASQAFISDAQKEGYLLPTAVRELAFYPSADMLRTRINSAITQLVLEVTEICNLRCRYCQYTYDTARTAVGKHMTLSTARQAVDEFIAHSTQAPARTISFWGGEPLVNLRLIREVVDYVEQIQLAPRVEFAFTTNATLINNEVAGFLVNHPFRLLVSVDGPKHIHDRNRLRVSGQGSFSRMVQGLKCLRNADPAWYETVRFNCVVGPSTPLESLVDFFTTFEFTAGHEVNFTPVGGADLPDETLRSEFSGLSSAQRAEAREMFTRNRQAGTAQPNAAEMLFVRQVQSVALRDRKPLGERVHPNGCCVPLLKKLVVRVDGSIYMCEQQPYMNSLGNIRDGIDLDRACDVVKQYTTHSVGQCKQCWAMRLCGACYRDSMVDSEWRPTHRAAQCDLRRERIRAAVTEYVKAIEVCPQAFDFMKDQTIVFPV